MIRRLCILLGPVVSKKVRHLLVSNGGEQEMDAPIFLVTEGNNDASGVMLYRFDEQGGCVGDTWHKSFEDAHHQAVFEYEGLVGDWEDIPPEADMAAFGLSKVGNKQ